MWTMFSYLRKLRTEHGIDRVFRIVGYGTVLILCAFVLFSLFLEPPSWTEATGDFLAGFVLTISLISIVVLLILRTLQSGRTVPIPILSPQSLRWVRALSVVSSICFLCVLGMAYSDVGLAGIVWWLPFWLPLLLVVAILRGTRLKKRVALAVTMGCALFFASIAILRIARDWEEPWWIQLLLSLAALAYLIMIFTAVRTYYVLPRERHDLRKLLGAFIYSFVVLLLLTASIRSPAFYQDPQTIHAQMARMKLEEINRATSAYATHFGGLFPESLDALGPPAKNQKADCRAAGLLHKPFTTNSGGYLFEYRTDLPSHTASGGCQGATHYTITSRPAVYGKTGSVNLYTDDSGVVRCTLADRPANADDSMAFLDFKDACQLVITSREGSDWQR